MTHKQRSEKQPRPCTAHDQTFGGLCLNCGYQHVYTMAMVVAVEGFTFSSERYTTTAVKE